jgi:hypothetical protein
MVRFSTVDPPHTSSGNGRRKCFVANPNPQTFLRCESTDENCRQRCVMKKYRSAVSSRHTVRLMPPSYVKCYVKRSKSDATDEVRSLKPVRTDQVGRPANLADVTSTGIVWSVSARKLINTLRAHLAEFGLVAVTGREGLAHSTMDGADRRPSQGCSAWELVDALSQTARGAGGSQNEWL